MNRKEIKELAKTKIKDNKWNILWPLIVIIALESMIDGIFRPPMTYYRVLDKINIPVSFSYTNTIIGIIFGIIIAGYYKYILNFVRKGKFKTDDIIDTVKSKWLNILIAEVLTFAIISICTMLFVVPGIIMSLAYAFVLLLVIDTDIPGNESLKKSREMMKGYKWDYFLFILSFIGWALLVPFTLGIILIWLAPYFMISTVIYYDRLQALTNNK